ncbi:phage tail protein [Brassicibacter mesophilus]|uniref:phage tail protein n=1 Tax=Brassicibacter mesophilus TaxID=745119 RepID=UPI003D1F0ED9
MAKSNFIVRGGANFSGLYNEFNKAQKRMNGFKSTMIKSIKGLGLALSGIAIARGVKNSTKAAMQVESSITQLGRTMGNNANEFENWAKTQAKSYGMAREEAFKYGATYSNLISTFSKGTEETTKRTTELLKASAVVASATGRTMEDTMERIRSGLLGNTEAIEDLGINVNVAMIESTEAFKQFARGRSWQQLNFQTQQQIRLMTILEQANTKYGNSLAGTTATKQMMFIATLKNVRLNLGQAFLPIYNVVLPILTTLASKLEYVTNVLAAFSQALFGTARAQQQVKATQQQASAVTELGDATEKAGKQAKGALGNFDEINQIGGKNESGAGTDSIIGGTSGLEMSGIESTPLVNSMNEVTNKAKEMAEKVKTAFTNMKNAIVENKNIIIPAVTAIGGAIAGVFLYNNLPVAIASVASAFTKLGGVIKGAWVFLASNPILLVVAAIGALIGALIGAYKSNENFKNGVDNLWDRIKTALSPVLQKLGETMMWLWQNVTVPFAQVLITMFARSFEISKQAGIWLLNNALKPLGNFLLWLWNSVLVPVGRILIDVLAVAFRTVSDVAIILWQNVLVPLGSFIGTVFIEIIKAVRDIFLVWWNNVLVPLGMFISSIFKPIIESLVKVFEFLWMNVLKPLANYMAGNFKTTFNTVTKGIGDVINGLKITFGGLINFITGVFTGDWRRAWEGVKNIFKGIFDSLFGIVKVPLNLIIDAINKVIGGLNKLNIKVPDWVPGFGGRSWGINISKIPKLARGSIIDSPTLAMVGEAGKEAVMPLENNTGWINDLANQIASVIGGSQGNISLLIKIGEDTITEKVISNINRQNRISGKTVIQV